MKRHIGVAVLVVLAGIALLSTPAPAIAVALGFTDDFTKTGFDIEYTLAVTPLSSDTYQGVFTISSSSTSADPWYIGAFDFKFFDGAGNVIPDITGISFTGSTGPWSIADVGNPNVSIQGWSRQDGRAGFYLTDLEASQIFANAQKGVYVSGTNDASFTFTFLNNGGTLNEISMPFQVAYFDGAKNQNGLYFGQLSADLAVPEPGTMVLLGSGLIGLAGYGRKRFRK